MFSAVTDSRDRDLARLILSHSLRAQPGEMLLVEATGLATLGLGGALVEQAMANGTGAHLVYSDPRLDRAVLLGAQEGSLARVGQFELAMMKNTDCYVGLRGSDNIFEASDVPPAKMDLFMKHIRKPVHLEYRVNHTRWCVLRYPNPAMAQLAQRSTEDFARFYYSVCLVDYAKMARDVQPLKQLMEATDRVHLKGPGTDLRFSIKGIAAVPCSGEHNIPDGECFTAPVADSMDGTVQFNTPTAEAGQPYENIRLRFEKGVVVDAAGANLGQTERLNKVLDRDPGARRIGEFALGFNPLVMHPMRDILFDEKIAGSFHMALGNAYNEADNGNRSSLHWDLVCIQRPDYGGGEVWFDDKLIRKDGLFVLPELKALNPG